MMVMSVPGRPRAISVSALAQCPFSAAQDYALEYLEPAAPGVYHAELFLRAPFGAMRHRVELFAQVEPDTAETGRKHDEIGLLWAAGSKLFPNFKGTLRLRIDRTQTRILLEGTYVPPLGRAGRFFDAVAGRWIARESLRDLAERIAAYLTARQAAWLLQTAA